MFAGGGALLGGASLDFNVAGRAGIPTTGIQAVALNLTVTNPRGPGYVTAWPKGIARPTASNLNFTAGETIPNVVIAPLSTSGELSVFVSGTAESADVIADVVGYFTTASGINAIPPTRLLDTRPGQFTADDQFSGMGPVGPGGTIDFSVIDRPNVPATGVGTVVLNVTATQPTASGYITVWPTDGVMPKSSNLNFSPGQTIPNLVISPVGPSGLISLFNSSGNTDLIADVQAWFPPETDVVPVEPARIMDSRNLGLYNDTVDGLDVAFGPIGPQATVNLQIGGRANVPLIGVGAAILNVTVTDSTADGFMTVWPSDASRPNASNLNLAPGRTMSNLVIAKMDATGQVSLFNSAGSTNLIVDILGWVPTTL
jgi:hypothetical protein